MKKNKSAIEQLPCYNCLTVSICMSKCLFDMIEDCCILDEYLSFTGTSYASLRKNEQIIVCERTRAIINYHYKFNPTKKEGVS